MYILVKNHGYEGLSVHGATSDFAIAIAWVEGGYPLAENEFIRVHESDPPSYGGLKSTRKWRTEG